jgi:hypothetical protein
MQREASTQQRLLAMGGGKDALTECLPHTMSGSLPSDEVGKSYRMRNEFDLRSRTGVRASFIALTFAEGSESISSRQTEGKLS